MVRSFLSAPYRALRKVLLDIPHPLARRAAAFLLMFFVSLAIGRGVEEVFSKQSVEAALRTQMSWIAKVDDMAPLRLWTAYLEDYGPASRGEFLYKRPPAPAPLQQEDLDEIAAYESCRVALALAPYAKTCGPSSASGESAAACAADPTRPECAAASGCLPALSPAIPPECNGLVGDLAPGLSGRSTLPGVDATDVTLTARSGPDEPARIFSWFAPLAALVRTVSRILGGPGWEPFFGILQIGLGAAAFLVATYVMSNGRHIGFDHTLANIIGGPIAVIAFASFGALALKWLMLGALTAFAWATGLAAMAAGATGFVGACWYCFSKLSEKGIEHVITSR